MLNLQYLVFAGAGAQFIGYLSYVIETLRGNTKPNKVTWFLWTIAPLIATFAAISDGVRWSVLPVFMTGFGPILILLASFLNKKSYWKLERFDYLCGLFSLLALILWGITKEPVVAIVFAIISDALAAIPTLSKAWKYPDSESVGPFITGLFAGLTSFAAIKIGNFAEYAFPAWIVFINTCLTFAILKNKIRPPAR